MNGQNSAEVVTATDMTMDVLTIRGEGIAHRLQGQFIFLLWQ
jgi:hypothetical protein